MQDFREKIERVVEAKIREKLKLHGGDLKIVDYVPEQQTVRVMFMGMCQGCSASRATFHSLVESELMKEIPQLNSIELIED